jgi:Fe2+ transport system protein FeoA
MPVGAVTRKMRLDDLPPAHCGFIVSIDADDQDADRLKAMGVCVGRRVESIKRGDPLILRVLGSRIGLSARLARRVTVDGCTAPECDLPH